MSHSEEYKIDFVLPWVDGNDVEFEYADGFAKFEIGSGKLVEIEY